MLCFGTRRIALKSHDTVRVYFLGDLHVGASASELVRVRNTIERIRDDPQGLVFLLGDLVDAISMDDKRFDPEALDGDVVPLSKLFEISRLEVEYVEGMLEPVADRIVGSVAGNHEDSIYKRHGGAHPTEEIARSLGLPPEKATSQRAGWFNLVARIGCSHIEVPIAVHHGFGGGRTKGNVCNKLVTWAAQFPDARVVAMGHMHDPNVLSLPPYMRFRRNGLHEQSTLLIAAGAFMRSYPPHRSYVEAMGLPPRSMSCPYAEIEFFRRGKNRNAGFRMRGVLELEG